MNFIAKYWQVIAAVGVSIFFSLKFDMHYRLLPVPDRNESFLATCQDALAYDINQCTELREQWGGFMDRKPPEYLQKK